VFTSESVKAGRQSVLWFIAITGLLFATIYSVGFAGVYWIQTQGIDIATADFDKMIFFLNFAFNGDTITGYVVAGAIAGAYHGLNAIPDRWYESLETGEDGRDTVVDLGRSVVETFLLDSD
jgi:hypothetical protein